MINKPCACGFFPYLGTIITNPQFEKETHYWHSIVSCHEIPEPKIIPQDLIINTSDS